jgi:hypothetical protein
MKGLMFQVEICRGEGCEKDEEKLRSYINSIRVFSAVKHKEILFSKREGEPLLV